MSSRRHRGGDVSDIGAQVAGILPLFMSPESRIELDQKGVHILSEWVSNLERNTQLLTHGQIVANSIDIRHRYDLNPKRRSARHVGKFSINDFGLR